MIGETISHYKILEKLGGGGMGVVYKAHDLKLDRHVALKFLPPELTRDAEAKERFIHEAKAASALDHNNICTIHEIGETDDGQMFIVMASYDGETLKKKIEKGPLKIEEATDLAIQIAQGLSEAHTHGIVHRDVKPANILITKSGVAKIVDFGLAKLSGASKLTKTGSTLGTVAYMAPEQLQGIDVDARADIFSVGVVLYEMLTGKTPFRGDHEAALMYSILSEEPEPLQTQIPDASSELVHVVSRSLEKDPANRYKTMDDLLIDLRRVRKETSQVSMPALWRGKRSLTISRNMFVMASLVVLACIMAVVFLLNRPRKLPLVNPNLKSTVLQIPINDPNFCSLSHDGKWIAFAGADQNGVSDVYYMNSAGKAIKRVTFDSTAFAMAEDCSPDGAWILYSRWMRDRMEVAAVPSLGGQVQFVAPGGNARFWPNSDRILYLTGGWTNTQTKSGKYEICSIKMDGSDNRVEFVDPGCSQKAGAPTVDFSPSPNGKSIAWVKTFQDFSQDIITYDFVTKRTAQVTFTRSPKGGVFWTRDNNLIYSAFANGNHDLWMCPVEGGDRLQVTRSRNDEITVALCDDGSKLLFYEQNVSGNLKSMDLETGKVTSITSDDQNRGGLCISPDNRYIAYTAVPSYPNLLTYWGIQILDTKGEHPIRTLSAEEAIIGSKTWSPGGKWIAYTRAPDSVGGKIKICVVSPFDGSRSRALAEANRVNIDLRWMGRDTVSWFSDIDMKTWICPIENSKPVQFFEDSTNARLIQGKKYVFYRDFRAGRQGWWIVSAQASAGGREKAPTRVLGPIDIEAIAPNGEFCLVSEKPGELQKISLPDGQSTRLPYSWPRLERWRSITQDGKAVVYIEGAINSHLTLWENPFIKG